MFTNRLFTTLILVALAAVVGLTVRQAVFTSALGSGLDEAPRLNHQEAETARWQAMGEFYARQAQAQRLKEAQPYIMDSSTRSYIAWAQAAEAEASTVDSATRSYIAQAKAVTCGVDATYGLDLDSASVSYIAWAKSLDAGTSCQ